MQGYKVAAILMPQPLKGNPSTTRGTYKYKISYQFYKNLDKNTDETTYQYYVHKFILTRFKAKTFQSSRESNQKLLDYKSDALY
jgi:hypothetical protein